MLTTNLQSFVKLKQQVLPLLLNQAKGTNKSSKIAKSGQWPLTEVVKLLNQALTTKAVKFLNQVLTKVVKLLNQAKGTNKSSKIAKSSQRH